MERVVTPELIAQATAHLQEVRGSFTERFGPCGAPRCGVCGTVRAVYGKKGEKMCRPCMYLGPEERRARTYDWFLRWLDYLGDVHLAELEVRRLQNMEKVLAELLRREIEAQRPMIEPTGLRVVAGKDVELFQVSKRFASFLKGGGK